MDPYIKSHTLTDHYLLVEAHGVRDTFLQTVEGTKRFYNLIEKTKSRYVILDYRPVTFNLNLADTFNVIKLYEQLPQLQVATLAAIINTDTIRLAKNWKEVAHQRGFGLTTFYHLKKPKIGYLGKLKKVETVHLF